MKTWQRLVFLSLLAPGAAGAATSGYALNCPGAARMISAQRDEWNKSGENIQPVGELKDERAFRYRRIVKMSSAMAEAMYTELPRESENNYKQIDWRSGIRLQPAALGLPAEINGCQVVPIFAPNPIPNSFVYLGSYDDRERLNAVDRLILFYRYTGEVPDEVLQLAFSEKPADFTTREFAEFMMKNRQSFQFRGEEMDSCLWDEAGHLKSCKVGLSNDKGLALPRSTVDYWQNGHRRQFNLRKRATLPLNDGDESATGKKVTCEQGPVVYREDGSFLSCENTYAENGVIRVSPKSGNLLFFDPESRLQGWQVGVGEPRAERIKKQFLPSGSKPYKDLWFDVFPDQDFQSGLAVKPIARIQEPFYLQVDEKGHVLRRINAPKGKSIFVIGNLVSNLGKVDLFMNLRRGEIIEFKFLVAEPTCAAATLQDSDSIRIPPACVGLLRVLFKETK